MNNVSLIGRLTKDAELRYIPVSGTAVANFTLAVDRGLSKAKKDEAQAQNQPTPDFIRITAWGKQAESIVNYTQKGRLVGVNGRITTGSYSNNQGERVYTFEVTANNVEFLEWGDKQGNQEKEAWGDGIHPTDNDDIPF